MIADFRGIAVSTPTVWRPGCSIRRIANLIGFGNASARALAIRFPGDRTRKRCCGRDESHDTLGAGGDMCASLAVIAFPPRWLDPSSGAGGAGGAPRG